MPVSEATLHDFLLHNEEYAIILLDLEGKVTGWLGAAQHLLGFTAEDMVGRSGSDIFIEADRRKGFDALELEIARGSGRSEDDRWHVRKDGTKVWVAGSVHALRDAAGVVIGYVKLLRDRTDLRMQMDSVEARLASSEAALQRTRAFLRTLGHEIRNPLAPLQTAATIIQRTSDDVRADRAVDTILGQIQVLSRLANDLMDISRLDAGKVHLSLQRTDLRTLLSQAHEAFKHTAREKGLNLILMVPKSPLWVDVDHTKFHQIASNLLSNAIKYTPAGGSIWIKGTQEGGDVIVRVEDNGVGIGPELLPRLFELFSRGESAEEMAPSGMGVGLSVVKELVELHHGTVQARSPGHGKGSEFTVRLNAADLTGQSPGTEPH